MTELAPVNEAEAQPALPAQPADPMVNMIERLVMNPDADIDKLERMLALKREHDRDNARAAFARALSAARSVIPPITKDATVDFTSQKGRTHYKHETLAGIAKVIDPILSTHGLSYRFRTEQQNSAVKVTCIIAHADGHSEETSLMCSPDVSGSKNAFQAVGSAVTYLQRYTLKAALGLSAEIDDDGQSAGSGQGQGNPRKFDARAAADHLISAVRSRKGDDGALRSLWGESKEVLEKMDKDILDEVKAEFANAAPAPTPPADLGDDTIAY